MYRRAGLSRIVTLVVALLCSAGSTITFAREFRSADNRNKGDPTVQAQRLRGHLVAGRLQIQPFHSRRLGEAKAALDQTTLEPTLTSTIDPSRINVGSETPAGIHAEAKRDIAITAPRSNASATWSD
ncbi:hypothetical protein [Bradyrhizobium lablabi]|uniref:hypothetical protein n=1 Tax=Bradyrhizobium lablabi TaxID=722472 RepID=UPI001BAE0E1A|nr:hypothetical protein [Bradyrhizobium lablabi]MBR0697307.1 hypothetical protein [Bradyrhizobium lablabi]